MSTGAFGSFRMVEQPTVPAELVTVRQRDSRARGGGLHPGGEDSLGLRIETGDEVAALTGPDGTGELAQAP